MVQKKKNTGSKKKKEASKQKEAEKEITPLAKIMTDHRISQKLLEEKSGVSHDGLYKIKTGKRKNPEVLTMKKIVSAINEIAGTTYKIDDLI